jgi:hypothetical protein
MRCYWRIHDIFILVHREKIRQDTTCCLFDSECEFLDHDGADCNGKPYYLLVV